MKKREKCKLNWAALLLAAALAVGIAPAWAEETDTAELAVSVSGGTFTFDVPFRTTESMSALVLADGRTGLSATYLFCSATSQTRGSSIDDIHVCDADGREKDGTIGEITAKGTVLQLTTYEQDAVRRYDFGTAQETVMQDFPDYLRATVDGKCKILTGITEWRVDRVFGAPGTYAFTPVLPERYKNYTVVCDYPDIQVTVLPPAGDMNGDGAVSIADAELLAAYYNGTRQLAQVQLAAADHQTNADIRGGCIAYILSYQKEDGSCSFGDAVNCESTAQVVTACATLGIDPHTDSRFVKNGKPAGDALLGFYDSALRAFRHVKKDNGTDGMATNQAAYAMTAYQRLARGQNSLYNMSDVRRDCADGNHMTLWVSAAALSAAAAAVVIGKKREAN